MTTPTNNIDPSMLQMLLLSQQVNKLKHSLDLSTTSSGEHKAGSRRNSLGAMPLKKRHKSSEFHHGSGNALTSLSPQPPQKNAAFTLATNNTTPPLVSATAAGISPSSLASLSALLGKKSPELDIATRLHAFAEAQRRSNVSRELLARATKELKSSSQQSSTAPTLSLALNPSSLSGHRVHSLSSLGAAGNCSRSGSLSEIQRAAGIGAGQAAMTSW